VAEREKGPEAFDAAVAKLRGEVKKRYVDEILKRVGMEREQMIERTGLNAVLI